MKPASTLLQRALVLLLWLVTAVVSAEVPLEEIRSVLRTEALMPPSEAKLARLGPFDLAIGLLGLDPYARWLPPASPQPAGRMGAELYYKDGQFRLLPYLNSPATAAGVTENAILQAIDGMSVSGRLLPELAERLTGAVGERRRLTVCTPPCARNRRVTVTLAAFTPRSVEVLNVTGQRLLRIRAFTTRETRMSLYTALTDHVEAMPVIDLRIASGGDLYEAFDSAGLFLAAGQTLASTTDRAGQATIYRATSFPKVQVAMPIVLIGPQTASAAEVFAGILHKAGQACLVGAESYGKCVSQTDAALRDGSVLRYTNRVVRFADGSSCEGRGLLPDVVVDAVTLADTPRLLAVARRACRSE